MVCKLSCGYYANLCKGWNWVLLMTWNNKRQIKVMSVLMSCSADGACVVVLKDCVVRGSVMHLLPLSDVL